MAGRGKLPQQQHPLFAAQAFGDEVRLPPDGAPDPRPLGASIHRPHRSLAGRIDLGPRGIDDTGELPAHGPSAGTWPSGGLRSPPSVGSEPADPVPTHSHHTMFPPAVCILLYQVGRQLRTARWGRPSKQNVRIGFSRALASSA